MNALRHSYGNACLGLKRGDSLEFYGSNWQLENVVGRVGSRDVFCEWAVEWREALYQYTVM